MVALCTMLAMGAGFSRVEPGPNAASMAWIASVQWRASSVILVFSSRCLGNQVKPGAFRLRKGLS